MTISILQQQAWSSVSPESVLQELTRLHQLKVDGELLTVTPAPCPRLAFQIRRFKATILELLGAGKTREERCNEAWRRLGVDPDTYQAKEREAIQQESNYKGLSMFPLPTESPPAMEPGWGILKVIREEYCQHKEAAHYRVKVDGKAVVKLLCPKCGHNLRGPRRMAPVKKRTEVPWWPEGGPIVPDPDAQTDALVEWWDTVEANVTDGTVFSQGVTVMDARKFKQTITELIGLWKLGDPDLGLKAQLLAHKKHLEGVAV